MLDLKGRFNINFIYLQSNNIDVLKANYKEEVYVLTWICKKFPSELVRMDNISQRVFPVYESAQATIEPLEDHQVTIEPLGDHQVTVEPLGDHQVTVESLEDHEIMMPKEEIQQSQSAKDYFIMHRRFAHMGRSIITKLHKDITHQHIFGPKHKDSYATCVTRKIKKKITRVVTPRKNRILDLISINACGPLPKSLINNITFLEIVDNHSRKHWRIYTKNRKSIPAELDT